MTSSKVIVTDIGGSHLCSGIYDLERNSLLTDSLVNTYYNAYGTKREIIEAWRPHFSHFIEYDDHALALPGPCDYSRGIALYFEGHKLSSLSNLLFENIFSEEIFERDINLKFINDAYSFSIGAAQSINQWYKKNLMFLTLGTGLGSTITIKGEIQQDSNKMYALPFQNGLADEFFSTRWFIQYILSKTNIKYSGVKEIIEQETLENIEELFRQFCQNLFRFIKLQITDNRIEHLVLGGNISKASTHIEKHLSPLLNAINVTLEFSDDTVHCALKGAASLYKS